MGISQLHSEARDSGTKNVKQFQRAVRYGILIIGALVAVGAITFGVSRFSFPHLPVSQETVQKVVCPDFSRYEVRYCQLGTDWSEWLGPADGKADNGLDLCGGPDGRIKGERRVRNGRSEFRFRGTQGPVTARYLAMKTVNGACPDVLTPN